MPKTIFFGNGINLLGKGESWDSVLMQLSEGKMLPSIGSNTLKYEYVVVKKLIIFASEVRIYEQRDTMSLVSITLVTLGG